MTPVRHRLAAAAVVGVLGCAATAMLGALGTAHAANASVSATSGNAFEPGRVVVAVGDTVTWTTTGGVNHTVTSSTSNWAKDDSIPVPGRSTAFTFRAAGQYNYFCRTHGTANSGMRGVVVVSAPARPAASPTRTASATARPTPSRTPSARPTPSPTRPAPSPTRPSQSPSTAPSRSPAPRQTTPPPAVATAAPIALPTTSLPAAASSSPVPLPTVADEPSEQPSEQPTVDLGSGGLGPPPATGRGRGLPAFLAVVALVGVVTAQLRALLALPPED